MTDKTVIDPNKDVEPLLAAANEQNEKHKIWLANEIAKLPADVDMGGAKELLIMQCTDVRLRMVRADSGTLSFLIDYPDELHAFLRHPNTPKHLRDTLAGAHDVNTEEPSLSVRRES